MPSYMKTTTSKIIDRYITSLATEGESPLRMSDEATPIIVRGRTRHWLSQLSELLTKYLRKQAYLTNGLV
jgi:hypothetical protein